MLAIATICHRVKYKKGARCPYSFQFYSVDFNNINREVFQNQYSKSLLQNLIATQYYIRN
ncbi:hypothetical protein CV014_14990 [Nostoc sp. CMAA1605]|nr:hypothetical protein [Nostoc sp. CMAA1605]